MSTAERSMTLVSGPSTTLRRGPVDTRNSEVAEDATAVYPLTHSQEGIWIDYLASPESTQYNLYLDLDFTSSETDATKPVTAAVIIEAINALVQQHAPLRSTIVLLKGKPHIQEHNASTALPFVRILGDITDERTIHQVLREPFDLPHDYPARWYILQRSRGLKLYLVAHHIAVDGGSMSHISRNLFEMVERGDTVATHISERFQAAHAIEARKLKTPVTQELSRLTILQQGWLPTSARKQAEAVCLAQIKDSLPFSWTKEKLSPAAATGRYRDIQSWAVFSKEDLKSWSSRFGTSWFRVATTLVGLLLHRESEDPLDGDHALSVAFDGRPDGFENTVGHFANALPIKIPVARHLQADGENTLSSLVRSVSSHISQVKKAQRLSVLDIARTCHAKGLEFDAPRVAVSYSPRLSNDACRLFPVEGTWDLFFVFLDCPEGIELGVVYDPKVFGHAAMQSMRESFEGIVAFSNSENQQLGDLFSLPKYLGVPPIQPNGSTFVSVHQMFQLHAESNPDQVALLCEESGEAMTYGELDILSSIRAKVLLSHGVCAESVVVLCLDRGFHLLEWILAVLKSGGAYVYLDPKLPPDRKMSILDRASGAVLVVDDDIAYDWKSQFSGIVIPHVTAHAIDKRKGQEQEVPAEVRPDQLAYMIFTSGSTGEPKGVMIEHGSFAHFVRSSTSVYGTKYTTRTLQLASFNFDASILEWSTTLAAGGTLCIAQSPAALVGEYLADVIETNQVSFMQITPTALATIPPGRDLPSLRCISIGGEAVPGDLIVHWAKRVRVINSYGPTETSIAVAFREYPKNEPITDCVSVGKSPQGTEVHICSPVTRKVLPHGVEGEVCISGLSLGRGYRNRQELTDSTFVMHPRLGKRLYRTGDRGMLLPDGNLVIHGRIDREIKVRGFRISPEEVEKAVVDAGTGVQCASVHPSPDGLALYALVTPQDCSAPSILQNLKTSLPAHMVPSRIINLPALPMTVSGKVDHKKIRESLGSYLLTTAGSRSLKPLRTSEAAPSRNKTIPSAVLEDYVAKVWQSEIGLTEAPSRHVNFFDMGGHSHMVPRLHKRMQEDHPGCEIRMVELFHHSTIASQAELLRRGARDTAIASSVDGQGDDSSDTATTTPTPTTTTASSPTLDNSSITTNQDRSVAVIGIAGKFPGADDPDELYENLTNGRSGIREDSGYSGQTSLPEGCLWVPRVGSLSGVEDFDHSFWKLTREEAMDMDPQQRLFLTAALQALDDARIGTFKDQANKIGVFVGAAANRYHHFTQAVAGDAFQRANRGFVAPCISARTAYHLNLHGPNVTINTNCASGTVALSLAIDALRNHRCDVAVVGGVSVQLFEGGYITQQGNIFSATGQCRPFEEESDGTVPSDAVVAVVLKRTQDVARDGDSAYALVAGAAYNSDGASQKVGFQVPSPQGQANAVTAAWANAGLSPEDLDYVELHGSGTPIGDALELDGLQKGLDHLGYMRKDCIVGSNKGLLGNTQQASGLTSLVKICKSIQHGIIPQMWSSGRVSPVIRPDLPLHFAYKPTKLRPDSLIGISAAGWGGVNSHVVIKVPPTELSRTPGAPRSKRAFKLETLAAPRLVSDEIMDDYVQVNRGEELIIQKLSEMFNGIEIGPHTDLRAAGVDSSMFVRLAHLLRNSEEHLFLPMKTLLKPVVTPSILAAELRPAPKASWVKTEIAVDGATTSRLFQSMVKDTLKGTDGQVVAV